MSSPPRLTAEDLKALDDQKWRRLGITQTFDRLLVASAACYPGPASDVVTHAAQGLSGGAAKFWQLSVSKIQQDLIRRRILALESSLLSLHDDFYQRFQKLVKEIEEGVSHVAPSPGANLEEIMERGRQRELERAKSASNKSRSSRGAPKRESGLAKPVKRSGETSQSAAGISRDHEHAPSSPSGDTSKLSSRPALFTSLRVNRLLDHLDHARLSTRQLGERLNMKSHEITAFLRVTDDLDITRVSKDKLVDLHWKGRELARTSDAERRMVLHSVVRELRAHAETSSVD